MPGKHAPESPRSFYLSVARAAAGAFAVLALVVFIALAVRSPGEQAPTAQRTPDASPTATARRTSTASPTPTATARELRSRARVRVLVLNATDVAGLAARVRERLLAEGYERVEIGNEPNRARSTVYHRDNYRGEGVRLGRDLDVERVRPEPEDLQGNAHITVVLGSDFEE